MKILEVHIDRFGQFHQWSCSFSDSNFLTVYGPNEAGKTTLVAFIKCIFFGFPRKSLLEPYTGDTNDKRDLGGSVTIETAEKGKVRIVRHLNRQHGQATLYLENGDVVGEGILTEWLSGIDRDLYEAIFCFDLEGLKGIDRLKPEELNHFLFSTGMMGNVELYELEKGLEKEAADLFKSGGRIPIVNQTISELNTLRGKIHTWEQQMDEYKTLKETLGGLNLQLEKLISEREQLEQDKREFLRYKACEPLMLDYRRVNQEMMLLPNTQYFPENGKERFEHWHNQSVTLQAELADIEQKMSTIQGSIIDYEEENTILQHEKEWQSLKHEDAQKEAWVRELAKLNEQIKMEKENIRKALEELNMSESDVENVKEIPVDLSTKQILKEWMNQWQEAIKRKTAFEIAMEEESSKLQTLKERHQLLKAECWPEDRFLELEQKVSDHHPERIEREKEQLNREWAAIKQRKGFNQLLARLKWSVPIGIIAVFSVLFLFLIKSVSFTMDLSIWGLGLLIAGITGYLIHGLKAKLKWDINEKQVLERLNALSVIDSSDVNQNQFLFKQEKAKREQLAMVTSQVDDGERRYHTFILKLEQINMGIMETESRIHEWRKSMGLPEVEISILPEVYQMAEKLRERLFHLEALEKQIQNEQSMLDDFYQKVSDLADKLNQPGNDLNACEKRLKEAKEQVAHQEKLQESLQLYRESYQSLAEKIKRYDEECRKLMEQAGATTEEDFYNLIQAVEQNTKYGEQLESIDRQLSHIVPQEEVRQKYFSWLIEGRMEDRNEEDFLREIDGYDHHIKETQKAQSDASTKLEHMEKDETYAELLHEYEEKRFLLNEKAKTWGTLNIALHLLKQAKEDYRETRLPKVLTKASDYLYQITNRVYHKIYYTEAEGFILERSDSVVFKAVEVSRGTSEQLYLSIRLALIDEFHMAENLPLIVDDGFVNFDVSRRNKVIEVLKAVGAHHQILLFTCHHYRTKDILELSRENGGGVEHVGHIVSDSAR